MKLEIKEIAVRTLSLGQTEEGLSASLRLDRRVKDYFEAFILKTYDHKDLYITGFLADAVFPPMIDAFEEDKGLQSVLNDFSAHYLDLSTKLEGKGLEKSYDLFLVHYEQEGSSYLALIRVPLREALIHRYEGTDMLLEAARDLLPAEGLRGDIAIVHAASKEVLLVGSHGFFAKDLLGTYKEVSGKKKLAIIEEKITSFEPEVSRENLVKYHQHADQYLAGDELSVEALVASLDPPIAKEIEETFKKQGVSNKPIQLNEGVKKELEKKKRFITDQGIELSIPWILFDSADHFSIKSNEDGTMTIEIKQVSELSKK